MEIMKFMKVHVVIYPQAKTERTWVTLDLARKR